MPNSEWVCLVCYYPDIFLVGKRCKYVWVYLSTDDVRALNGHEFECLQSKPLCVWVVSLAQVDQALDYESKQKNRYCESYLDIRINKEKQFL